jgi:hypothetical protein
VRTPIFSTRSDDPQAANLIDQFIVGLAERVDRLQDAQFKGDLNELAELARVLGSTAEGLGYGVLAASASDVEGCCLAGEAEEVRDALIDLTEIAKRIRKGHRGSV